MWDDVAVGEWKKQKESAVMKGLETFVIVTSLVNTPWRSEAYYECQYHFADIEVSFGCGTRPWAKVFMSALEGQEQIDKKSDLD